MGCSNSCCYEVEDQNENKGRKVTLNPQKNNKINKKYKGVTKLDEKKKKFIEKALSENNNYREKHRVEKLELDEELIERAFILAYQKLEEGNFSNNYQKNIKNEVLGLIYLESNEELEADKLMQKWYSDLIEYNPKEPDEIQGLDSTKMIWKSSKKFGIGYYNKNITKSKNKSKKEKEKEKEKENREQNKYCYVALYHPAGNQPDEYKNNIIDAEKNIKELKNQMKKNNQKKIGKNNEETMVKSDGTPNKLKEEEEENNSGLDKINNIEENAFEQQEDENRREEDYSNVKNYTYKKINHNNSGKI